MLEQAFHEEVLDEPIYSPSQLSEIDLTKAPNHLAIIMDGNRRWAKHHNLPFELGYAKGADNLKEIVKAAIELNISTLTAFAFSTENWKRPKEEVDILLELFRNYLLSECDDMVKNKICLKTIGDTSVFDRKLQSAISETEKATANGDKFQLVLALNYGGRDDLVRATRKISKLCVENKLDPNNITENTISQFLDTAELRNPDLLIRSSGEFRVSNFLIWQLAYTEVAIHKDCWPEFTPEHLLMMVKNYTKRERRCGS